MLGEWYNTTEYMLLIHQRRGIYIHQSKWCIVVEFTNCYMSPCPTTSKLGETGWGISYLGGELDAEIPEPLGKPHVLGIVARFVQVTVAEVLPGHALHLRVECHIACGCRTLFKFHTNSSDPQEVHQIHSFRQQRAATRSTTKNMIIAKIRWVVQ